MTPRYCQRASVKCPAVLSVGPLLGRGQVLDLTIPGCMLETTVSIKVGDRMQLKCFLPDTQPLYVNEGFVRWVNDSRCGVEFVKMAKKECQHLNEFVAMQLSRQGQRGTRKFSAFGVHDWPLKIHALPKQAGPLLS